MLPGGLDIVGIFALAPPDMMAKAQTRLRQVSVTVVIIKILYLLLNLTIDDQLCEMVH